MFDSNQITLEKKRFLSTFSLPIDIRFLLECLYKLMIESMTVDFYRAN